MSPRPPAAGDLPPSVAGDAPSPGDGIAGERPLAEVRAADDAGLVAAVDLLVAGGVIGLPTETVYGLAADAGSREAVAQIYRIKSRPTDHPLIVHVLDATVAARWAVWEAGSAGGDPAGGDAAGGDAAGGDAVTGTGEEGDDGSGSASGPDRRAALLAAAFWPGPLTLVLRRRADAPPWACAGQPTIALRSPSHPVARAVLEQALLRGVDGLAAPSANRYGRVSPTRAIHVVDDLGGDIALVLDGGEAEVGIESTIVDLSGPRTRVLRPGGIAAASIFRVLGSPAAVVVPAATDPAEGTGARRGPAQTDQAPDAEPTDGGAAATPLPRVPGDRPSHYAPVTRTVIVTTDDLATAIDALRRAGQRVALWSTAAPARAGTRGEAGARRKTAEAGAAVVTPVYWRARPTDPVRFAHDLYEGLRELDRSGCDVIVIEAPPAGEAWAAVNDRLARASAR